MDCTQSLVGTWASMTPLNAARPRAGVDVARGREDLGRKADRNQQEERGERTRTRPESESFLFVKPSTGRHGSEAPSTKDGELGLVEAEPFLIGPETSKRKTEGFARTGGKSPGDVSRERHHNLGTPGR